MAHITALQFTSRFVAIMMVAQSMPKKQPDRDIIYVSAIPVHEIASPVLLIPTVS